MGCSGRYMWDSPGHSDLFSWVHDPKDEASHRCEEYWNRVSHLPFYKKLVIKNPGKTIPLSWHMDGVKVYKTHKVWAYSHSSAIRKGQSIDTKTLFLLFRDSDVVKPHTHDAVAKLIAYTMDVLQSGVFPYNDLWRKSIPTNFKTSPNGQGLTLLVGWCAAFACFKADLEGRVLAHKLARNWASDSICEHCLASKLPECLIRRLHWCSGILGVHVYPRPIFDVKSPWEDVRMGQCSGLGHHSQFGWALSNASDFLPFCFSFDANVICPNRLFGYVWVNVQICLYIYVYIYVNIYMGSSSHQSLEV